MPNVIACYKWVLDESDIRVEPNGTLNLERAGRKISDYDKNAIEAAVQIVEQQGGSVTAMSLGAPEVKSSAKDALSRGPDRAVLVLDPKLEGAGAHLTALGLARASAQAEPYDLIICGEGSGDNYAQQVGPRLATLLGIPCISFVSKLNVTETGVVAERKLEDGTEVIEASFPVLVTVLPEINKPRIPGLKQVMGASKKEVRTLDAAAVGLSEPDLAPQVSAVAVSAPAGNRKQVRVQSVAELAEAIAAAL